MTAEIDEADYELVSQHKWRAIGTHAKKFYAETGRNRDRILMHRLLLKAPDGFEIDHRDGNGLNNRRYNIRIATKAQNRMNRPGWGETPYKGVRRIPERWAASIQVNGNRISLGMFDTAEAAARAYDEAARKYHGEFTRLNFS